MATDSNTGEELKSTRKKNGKRNSVDLEHLVFGKIQPQAKDLEQATLGAMMLERDAIDFVTEYLKPESFYDVRHGTIYQAMLNLLGRSNPIDILTVVEELRNMQEIENVGGAYYVTQLTNFVVSSANIEHHAKIILQKAIQRELIRIGAQMVADAYESISDPFDLLDGIEQDLLQTTQQLNRKNFVGIDSLLIEAVQEIDAIRKSPEQLSGVPSGFKSFDKITHGWQPTDLIILAARPGVGKTALALNLARNAALDPFKPTPTAFFSMEMSSKQLIRRLMAAESEIPLVNIQRARMEDQTMMHLYKSAIQKLSSAPIYIDDTAALNIYQLRAKARRIKSKKKVGLIIIDYLQLMSGVESNGHRNREQEIATISRGLKKLAKELEIPIIALSQLSRETEKRADKTPQLSDLRESGAIEQDADAVMFMFRPEYYGIQKDAMGESTLGETHIRFAKYRNGSPDTAKLSAKLYIQKFTEMDVPWNQPALSMGLDFKSMAANDDTHISGPVVNDGGPGPF